jgi:ribosomal protein S18 acetylase RimI-like enzyme
MTTVQAQTTVSRTEVHTSSAVEVAPVTSAADRRAFIQFQYTVHRALPHFVPPLWLDRESFLNPKKNPWFEFGKAELFLARRAGTVVGRIAAVVDPRYNEFHGTSTGFFGLFECIDDVDVARALLDTVERRLIKHGFTEVLGPASFSSNGEWGFLAEGFDQPPSVMMPYNPNYYLKLVDACGYGKAKDLWAWYIDAEKPVPEKVARISEKIRQREGVTVRPASIKHWAREIAIIKRLYNAAWEKNWGFVPMTDKEFDVLGREVKLVLNPALVLFAEVKGEPVAFSITVPDANQAIRKANGRLLPFGLIRMMLELRRIRTGRLIGLGIKEEYRRRGIDSLLVYDTFTTAQKLGWSGGEVSWTLEDNDMVNRVIAVFGGTRSKTYRVFQKSLVSAAPLS